VPGSVRTRWAVGAAVGAAALVAIAIAVWPDATIAQDPDISVSRSGCGIGWTHPKPGPQTLQLHNTGSVTIGVDLIDPKTGTIYGEVEAVGNDPPSERRPGQWRLRLPLPARGRRRTRRPGGEDHWRGGSVRTGHRAGDQ
jgi:iron uptake system component EfeO